MFTKEKNMLTIVASLKRLKLDQGDIGFPTCYIFLRFNRFVLPIGTVCKVVFERGGLIFTPSLVGAARKCDSLLQRFASRLLGIPETTEVQLCGDGLVLSLSREVESGVVLMLPAVIHVLDAIDRTLGLEGNYQCILGPEGEFLGWGIDQ